MDVAIVGSGMAGLLAAKACIDFGIRPDIFSNNKKPDYSTGGVRYLHDDCGLPIRPFTIRTMFLLDHDTLAEYNENEKGKWAALYAKKTGSSAENNSVHRSEAEIQAYRWDLAFDLLQGLPIIQKHVGNSEIRRMSREYDLVVNTAPLPSVYPKARNLCQCRNFFVSDEDVMSEWHCDLSNTIVYNLDPDCDWYRYSNINGAIQTEWMHRRPGGYVVTKVNGRARFGLHPDNVMLVGRYGAWDATYMAHQAYYDVRKHIEEALLR